MKKVIFIVLASAIVLLGSCNKNYSCTCSGGKKLTVTYTDDTAGKTAATADCAGRSSTADGVCLLD